MQSFKPEGIGKTIFEQRYAINSKETWDEACMRVASHVSNAEVTFQLKEEYRQKFYEDLLTNKFMPGGRIWYGSKRKKGGLINCFAEDVPVCTKRGLVPIKDIEVNDMVLTEDGTFQKVVNKINQGHREKLLFIDVDRMPNVLKVTPDHKIMTQRGWVEAKDLTTEDYVSVPGCNNVESIPDEINILDFLDEEFYNENLVVDNSGFIRKLNSGSSKNSSVGEYNKQWLPIKNNIKIDENFMKFIGYYISEGCAENNGYRTIFTFSGKERSYVEEVKELFVKIFAKAATVQDYDTWMQVGTSSKIVNSFMKNFIGAGFGSKILPWWFLNLPNNFLNILLAYTCRGDAHIDQTTGSIVLVMCNPNIMMQLFYIAQKLDLGMSFSFLYKKEKRHSLPIGLRITKKWTYSKNFDEISDLIGKFKIKNDKFFRKINSVSEIFYGKDVWDISVDTNHSLQVAGMVASNCFVIKPEDSRESWGKTTSDMLVISGLGGGVGLNFSAIRPKGEKIKGVGGEASGPISLMKIINNVGEEIKTGGGRRVALMFCLNIDHPDILDFLQCKYSKKAVSDADFMDEWNSHFIRASHDPQYLDSLNKMLSKEESRDFVGKIFKLLNDKKIQNANVSVVIPEGQFEKFVDAVRNDKDWQLKWKGGVKKTIKAKELWKTLVDNAYESAEPGILNFDLAERMSNISYYAKISSTNPCGEICMQPNSVCCLGSLVLPRFHNKETGFFDFDGLSQTIKNAVRFLDNVLEINKYPTKETKKEAKKTRRIGLGIMGLHDLLLMRGLKYSSPEGLSFVSRLMNLIKNDAYEASIELAKEKGSFAVFNFEGYSKSGFFKSLDPDLQKSIEDNGIRNCAILSIAPTGTISMVCGVTSGIEPIFAYAYKRKYFKGDNLEVENVIHPLYRECIENGKSVDHFQSSYDLSVKDHLEIQKVCQVHVDQAISKTINVPANYPKEELYSLFLDYLPYLKGLTIYVDGSRGGAPLESMSYEEASQVISCPKGVCEIG